MDLLVILLSMYHFIWRPHKKVFWKKVNIITTFSGKSLDANSGRHEFIKICIPTRSAKKVFMTVSLKLLLRYNFW